MYGEVALTSLASRNVLLGWRGIWAARPEHLGFKGLMSMGPS